MRRLLVLALVGCGRVIDDAPDASPVVDAAIEATDSALLDACDRYYDARYNRCGGPRLPPDENARVKARFEQVCANEIALEGSGVGIATLDACASALEVSDCDMPDGPPMECDFRGALSAGATCTDDVQCASGRCVGQAQDLPTPWSPPIKCGSCAPVANIGDVCSSASFWAPCVSNATCVSDPPSADGGAATTAHCALVTRGDVGAACDGSAMSCALGLYCATQTKQCTTNGPAGATCGVSPGYPGGCIAPLDCVGSPDASTCSIGSIGASCGSWLDCNAGLSCVHPPSTTAGTCQPFTWTAPQAPCNDDSSLCLVGACGPTSTTCPSIVPDGRPCTAVDTCDTFSDCFIVGSTADSGFVAQGTCVLHDSVACH